MIHFPYAISFVVALVLASPLAASQDTQRPHPVANPESPVMLVGDWVPEDPRQIDFAKLPRVPSRHVIISDVRDQAGKRVHQHAYLARYGGRYWAMWSDGPGLPRPGATPEQHRNIVPGHDRPGNGVSYATSLDGLDWTDRRDLAGPPRIDGFGWISRGMWVRDGQLLALASHFNAPDYAGVGLSLEAFRWDEEAGKWLSHGTVLDDSLNNFPPKRLPTGEWMMTRRDHQRQVSVMIGGVRAFDQWQVRPLASYDGNGRPEEPYWYLLPDGKNIVGLIRDNGRSGRLLRTFSTDNGRTWSPITKTNFPDATSKFFVHRTSRGYYVLVSNANPRRRNPLTLAISQDGLVFDRLFYLVGGRHIDYPHIIEHDDHLLIAFSGAKQTMEVMKVSLDDLERLAMPPGQTEQPTRANSNPSKPGSGQAAIRQSPRNETPAPAAEPVASTRVAADEKPNIVLVVADDLGYGDLGCYGSRIHRTPNIDALAESGMRFVDFHTNGPVCSPTRAALMTGQYQQRCGIESAIGFVTDEGLPLSKVTIAEILADQGYTCGVIGKWHLGHVTHFGPNDQGFDLSYCSNNSPDYHSHVSRSGKLDWYKDHRLHQEEGYLTDLVTDHANEFIESNKGQPFFLFVSHLALHFPFQGPGDPAFRTEGKLWHGSKRVTGIVQPDSKYGPLPPGQYRRAYGEMLHAVDDSLGALVSTLEKHNLIRRTLIVFTSDNGAYSWVGSNGVYRGQKGTLFEGGHRVPAIFSWPGRIQEKTVSDAVVMTMDVAPTLSSIAGVQSSAAFDGIDISPVLFQQASLPARTLFWRFNNAYTTRSAQAVRQGDWKYVGQNEGTFLFNLSRDPGEQLNLAEQHPGLVNRMRQAWRNWQTEVDPSAAHRER